MEDPNSLKQTLQKWLDISHHREQRRFLEAHLELLTPQGEHILKDLSTHSLDQPEEVQKLHMRLMLLRDARERGGTPGAICAAYVNRYGGFTLDLPPWLEEIEEQLDLEESDTSESKAECIRLLRETIRRASGDSSLAVEIVAELFRKMGKALADYPEVDRIKMFEAVLKVYTLDHYPFMYAICQTELASAYENGPTVDRQANLERAIACYEAALQVFSYEAFPLQWAGSLNNLGNLYSTRTTEGQQMDVEQAIACYEKALKVYTRDTYPIEWAILHYNLAIAYRERINGDPRTNIELSIKYSEAALQVYTREEYPIDWADVQGGLGLSYQDRFEGDQRANQEQAIACYQAALEVYTANAYPAQWAWLQSNLGVLYLNYVGGERRANLEQAIIHVEQASQIYTRTAFPLQYAMTRNNLGLAYSYRIEGERRINLERAIAYCEEALQIYTREAAPFDWAMTQNNLGTIYHERIEGESQANLEQALKHYELALQVYTRDNFPARWVDMQYNLGIIYLERLAGEARMNLEQAIDHFEAALQIYTREAYPRRWADIQRGLGTAYDVRIAGNRDANLEKAIEHFNAALQVYTPESFPIEWALTQNNLGNTYSKRTLAGRWTNVEQGIDCYNQALRIYTRTSFPVEWARTLNNLGTAYLRRTEGEQGGNAEKAIEYYQQALQVYTQEAFPISWSMLQNNLGVAYTNRVEGERYANLEQAIAYYKQALQVRTLEAFPADYRETYLNLAHAETGRENWQAAHEAYVQARTAEDFLVLISAGEVGRDAILKEGRDAALRDGFVLVRLGQAEQAAVAIESGRARGLAEALMFDAAGPERISDEQRRKRYVEARQRLIDAQFLLTSPPSRNLTERERRHLIFERTKVFREAKQAFDGVVAEIQAEQDPADFLKEALDSTTILHAAHCGGKGHALVYLAPTYRGGIAIGVVSANPDLSTSDRFIALDLPSLTSAFVSDLTQTWERDNHDIPYIAGGFVHAQEGNGFEILTQDWVGKTFREVAESLHTVSTLTGKSGTLDLAAQAVLAIPRLRQLVEQPLSELEAREKSLLVGTLRHHFLRLELERCLGRIGEVAIRPLITWLLEEGVTSLTLIPCGRLAAFPLTAIPLADGRTVSETLPTSVAPSARSLLREGNGKQKRSGVYAIGDPWPTRQPLAWGEAEAHTLAKLARLSGLQGEAKVQYAATRDWLIKALQKGLLVDASCHGIFDLDDFLESALILARNQRLKLADVLGREVNLYGLRLLILSACQTAITDTRGAVNEVRSIATGMVQAGADAVLAALWSVDDEATYLLIVRFAQEWLSKMEYESPAAALARAQHWLRNVTNRQLKTWHAVGFPEPTIQERREAGSEQPELDPWEKKTHRQAETEPLVAIRGLSNYRYEAEEAVALVQVIAEEQSDPDACPYFDPIYWASFQITGW